MTDTTTEYWVHEVYYQTSIPVARFTDEAAAHDWATDNYDNDNVHDFPPVGEIDGVFVTTVETNIHD